MDPGAIFHGLFRDTPGTVRLHKPVAARTARMQTARTITCENITVVCDDPIAALCSAMAAKQLPDSALQVVDRQGVAVCFVESIHQTARDGRAGP